MKREREGQRDTESKPEKETTDYKVWRGYIHFIQLKLKVISQRWMLDRTLEGERDRRSRVGKRPRGVCFVK